MGLRTKTAVSAAGMGLAGGAIVAKKAGWFGSAFKVVGLKRGDRAPSDYEAMLDTDNAFSSLFRTVKADLHERGIARDVVIHALDRLRLTLRASERGDDEEAVSDVLDAVYGFAPARNRL